MATRFLAFLNDLDTDLRTGLQAQLRVLWTHHSTAIEGNTLTLGETDFVLGEGLTVGGKPLKDHQEVVGHARAIDLLTGWLREERPLTEIDLFALHQAVQTEVVVDIFQPVGDWKVEPNGTQLVIDGRPTFNDTYAYPPDVPALMKSWLAQLADARPPEGLPEAALAAYVDLHASFARIHPFADGNGRLARLLANVPILEAGHPPLVIPRERRRDYITALARWQLQVGRPAAGDMLTPDREGLAPFVELCQAAWQSSLDLVAEYRQIQVARQRIMPRPTAPGP